MRVEEALTLFLPSLAPPAEEKVALAEAWGRRLSRPVCRRLPSPPFTRSRVDGYALGELDLAAAGPGKSFVVRGVVFAGGEAPEGIPSGTVLRVMTGAPLPPGTGAVVPFEETQEGTEAGPGTQITLVGRPERGANVIPAGWEGEAGSLLLPAGVSVGPVEMGLLASAGEEAVTVFRRPRVAVIATGSELVPLGQPLLPGRIYASNLELLAGLVTSWGGEPVRFSPVPDQSDALCAALAQAAQEAELVLVTGGAAAGDRDLARRAALDLGWRLLVDDLDFHPGGRCAVAQVSGRAALAYLLSGGPGACLTAAILLVVPALARLAGGHWERPVAVLGSDCPVAPAGVPSGQGRRRAIPVRLRLSGGRLSAIAQPHSSGSPVISHGTEGLILFPPGGRGEGSGRGDRPAPQSGELVEVWPLTPWLPVSGGQGKM